MRQFKKVLALSLGVALVVSSLSGTGTAQAAAKTKLSKAKLTIKAGKKATLILKNVKKKQLKKVKWSISNKKVAVITVKKKNVVSVKGKKAGKAKITAKLGKKKYICKVTVKAAKKKTTKPTASASGGAVTASGSATTGSNAANAPAGKNPLLFTTAAPAAPASKQPAYRETPAPTETPVVLNTSKPGGIPEGEQGEVQEPRPPFTLPNSKPGTVFDGGAEPMPTATTVPVTSTPSALKPTAVPADQVLISGTAYASSSTLKSTVIYFYRGDNSVWDATATTDSTGMFSVSLPKDTSDDGTEYTAKAYINMWNYSEETLGSFMVYDSSRSGIELDDYDFSNQVENASILTEDATSYYINPNQPLYLKVTTDEYRTGTLKLSWDPDEYSLSDVYVGPYYSNGTLQPLEYGSDTKPSSWQKNVHISFSAGSHYIRLCPKDSDEDPVNAYINVSFVWDSDSTDE